jgi:hypothetical protein
MSDQYPLHLIAKKPNSYGFSGLNRSAHIRAEEDWLDRLMTAPETRMMPPAPPAPACWWLWIIGR